MTPKEKARELINGFYQPLGHLKCGVNNTVMWEHAKQCALIALDEIVNCDSYFNSLADAKEFINYWYEVQKEIENF